MLAEAILFLFTINNMNDQLSLIFPPKHAEVTEGRRKYDM